MSLTKVSFSMISGSVANVLDYGADPTGATNSASAIQAAINSGLPVWFPPESTFLTNSTLTVTADSKFYLNGSTINSSVLPALLVTGNIKFILEGANGKIAYTGSSTGFVVEIGDHVAINENWGYVKDFTIDGNTTASGMKIDRFRYGLSENIQYFDCGELCSYFIETFGHVETRGKYLPQTGFTGLLIKNTSILTIESCFFQNNGVNSIALEYAAMGGSFVDSFGSSIKILGNNFGGQGQAINIPRNNSFGIGNILIGWNFFEGDGTGLAPFVIGVYGAGTAVQHVHIINNSAGSNDMADAFLDLVDFVVLKNNYLSGFDTQITVAAKNLDIGQNNFSGLINASTEYLFSDAPFVTTVAWASATIANGASAAQNFTVAGAAVGDRVEVIPPYGLQNCSFSAYASAANSLTIVVTNNTGGSITIPNGNWAVRLFD